MATIFLAQKFDSLKNFEILINPNKNKYMIFRMHYLHTLTLYIRVTIFPTIASTI